MVFSIDSEFVENENENVAKQDCELNAFKRMAERIKSFFKRLPIIISGDALYACSTVVDICKKNNWEYVEAAEKVREHENVFWLFSRKYDIIKLNKRLVNMLRTDNQVGFNLSNHEELYNILIDKNNFWRQLNEMVDFSFVYEELKDKYSSTMGRNAEDVKRMFKYLLLNTYYKLFDRGLIERTKTDMLFKYFLEYTREETNLIDSSLLTVFRRERLSNKESEEETSTNLLDKLIRKTVEIALK